MSTLPNPASLTNETNIPAELREINQWILWAPVLRNGKVAKQPRSWMSPRGDNIDINDRAHWTTFESAVAAMRADTDGLVGIGLVLSGTGVICLDYDDHEGDNPEAVASGREFIADLLDTYPTYAETSVQGKGQHVFYHATLPHGLTNGSLAPVSTVVYSQRFIAITGNVISWTQPVANGQTVVDSWKLPPPVATTALGTTEALGRSLRLDDADVISTMIVRRNAIFNMMNSQADLADRSTAYAQIIGDLDKITGNPEQIDRIIRKAPFFKNAYNSSKYDQSPKWLAKANCSSMLDYWLKQARTNNTESIQYAEVLTPERRQMIIEAFEHLSKELSAKKEAAYEKWLGDNTAARDEVLTSTPTTLIPTAPPISDSALADDDSVYIPASMAFDASPVGTGEENDNTPRFQAEYPPGVYGEVARQFYEMMPFPNKTSAIAWTLGAAAALAQRTYHVSGLGLSIFVMNLQETGGGKDTAVNAQIALLDQISAAISAPLFRDSLLGPTKFASGPAMSNHMARKPTQWSVLNEASFLFQEIKNDKETHAASKKAAMLDIRFKCDLGKFLGEQAYAGQTTAPTGICYSPSLSLFCEGQPERFYDSIDEQSATDGIVNRFNVFDSTRNHRGRFNQRMRRAFEARTIEALAPMAGKSLALAKPASERPEMIEVRMSNGAHRLLTEFNTGVIEKLSRLRDRIEYEIINRAYAQSLSIAASLAAPRNPDAPVISTEEMRYAIKLVYAERQWILNKYRTNAVGTGDLKRLATVKTALKMSYATSKSNKLSTAMRKHSIVPYSWFVDQLKGYAAFKPEGARTELDLLKHALQAATNAGVLFDPKNVLDEIVPGARGIFYGINWDALKD